MVMAGVEAGVATGASVSGDGVVAAGVEAGVAGVVSGDGVVVAGVTSGAGVVAAGVTAGVVVAGTVAVGGVVTTGPLVVVYESSWFPPVVGVNEPPCCRDSASLESTATSTAVQTANLRNIFAVGVFFESAGAERGARIRTECVVCKGGFGKSARAQSLPTQWPFLHVTSDSTPRRSRFVIDMWRKSGSVESTSRALHAGHSTSCSQEIESCMSSTPWI